MLKRGQLEKRVLKLLANGDWQTTKWIADRVKRAASQVRGTLIALEEKGMVRRDDGGGESTITWQSMVAPIEKRVEVSQKELDASLTKLEKRINKHEHEDEVKAKRQAALRVEITAALRLDWEALATRIEVATKQRDQWQGQIDRLTAERIGLEGVIQRREATVLEPDWRG